MEAQKRMARISASETTGCIPSLDPHKPRRIRDYAQAYGVLDICSCGLPNCKRKSDHGQPNFREDTEDMCLYGWDSLASWGHFIRRAKAIVNALARLHDGKPADLGNLWPWSDNFGLFPGVSDRLGSPVEGIRNQQYFIVDEIQHWLDQGEATPCFQWFDKAQFSFRTLSLFGHLGMQLALMAAWSMDFRVLRLRHRILARGRPKAGFRNYCNDCRTHGVPVRDAMRDYRASKSTPISARKLKLAIIGYGRYGLSCDRST